MKASLFLPARRVAIAAALPLLLTACQPGVLDPRGSIGIADRTILLDSLAIMLAIVIPTVVATLAVAWWFRASNQRARYLPRWAYSGRVELVVWAIPTMVVILLAGVTWIGSHELDPARPLQSKVEPLDIDVVSLDWKWLFIYRKAGVASVNRLVVPAGVPLHFSLTSASVMNTFFVPQLGSMIYTMNGMVTELNLHADEPGTFRGISGHFSGEGFSDMHFDVQALPVADFAEWLRSAHTAGPMLDDASYTDLAKPTINVPPSMYGSVDAGLFRKIVLLDLAPGPGPATENAGADQAPLKGH